MCTHNVQMNTSHWYYIALLKQAKRKIRGKILNRKYFKCTDRPMTSNDNFIQLKPTCWYFNSDSLPQTLFIYVWKEERKVEWVFVFSTFTLFWLRFTWQIEFKQKCINGNGKSTRHFHISLRVLEISCTWKCDHSHVCKC